MQAIFKLIYPVTSHLSHRKCAVAIISHSSTSTLLCFVETLDYKKIITVHVYTTISSCGEKSCYEFSFLHFTLIFFIQSAAFTQSLMVNTHHTNGLNACFMILLFFFILYG